MDYLTGDFLIRLKNASLAHQRKVLVPKSALNLAIARLLQKQGVLSAVRLPKGKAKDFTVEMSYYRGSADKPALADIKLFSKPGRRYYSGAQKIPFPRGKGFVIVSTPKGIMLSSQARRANMGGEVIAMVLMN